MSFLKQPLLHFLLLGLLLFVLFELTATRDDLANRILVDRDALLTHMQFRSRNFDRSRFEQTLTDMTPTQLQQLIDDYVREETLHREALALGLEANDYIIRQRLIQKVEYLARGFETPAATDLEAYYAQHKQRYIEPAAMTFTHVFVNVENYETPALAKAEAGRLLTLLTAEDIDFAGAMRFGERFAFHKNYVDRTREFVASHFGDEFAEAVFKADVGVWQGPLASAFGWHLVLISERTPSRQPPLDEIAEDVQYDAQQDAIKAQTTAAIDEISARYEVVIDL